MGCRSRQNDKHLRCCHRPSRREGHRRLSQRKLRDARSDTARRGAHTYTKTSTTVDFGRRLEANSFQDNSAVALEVWPSLAVEKIEDLRGPALASRSMTVLTSSRIKEASTF